jgi:hypothetical protein
MHFIPYVNSPELLKTSYESCKHIKDVYIIDNREPYKNNPSPEEVVGDCSVIVTSVHLSTAQIMNYMLQLAKICGDKHFTWQHCDVSFNPEVITNFYNYLGSVESTDWGIIYTAYDLLAAFNVDSVDKVGGWDSLRFPWYFLDNDISIRLYKAGYKLVNAPHFGEIHHHHSSTIRNDSERNHINSYLFPVSQQLFYEKYSGQDINTQTIGDYK